VLRLYGVPNDVAHMFYKACVQPLKLRTKEGVRFKASIPCRAATGSAFTTVMNGVASVQFIFHFMALAEADPTVSFAVAGADLGFVTKQEDHQDICQCIFLKGAFLPKADGYGFANLPSLVLKMGKHLTPPTVSQKVKDEAVALAMIAGAMGNSLPQLDRDAPVIGAFLAALRRCGKRGGSAEERPYKTYGGAIPRATMVAFMEKRYGVTEGEIEELEGMLDAVTSIPCFIQHPVVARMTLRDYY